MYWYHCKNFIISSFKRTRSMNVTVTVVTCLKLSLTNWTPPINLQLKRSVCLRPSCLLLTVGIHVSQMIKNSLNFSLVIPNTPGLLPKWQLIVAGAALFNTVQCLLTTKLTRKVYNKTPDGTTSCILPYESFFWMLFFLFQVTALQARTFSVWTLTSAIVRFYAAYHINDKM